MEKILSIVLSFIIGFFSYPLRFIPSLNDTEFSASEVFFMDFKSYSPIEYDYYLSAGNTTEIRTAFSTLK